MTVQPAGSVSGDVVPFAKVPPLSAKLPRKPPLLYCV
jgi:hypothetical protein